MCLSKAPLLVIFRKFSAAWKRNPSYPLNQALGENNVALYQL